METSAAVVVNREAIDGCNIFADAGVANVGHKAVDRGNAFAGARIIDVGRAAIVGGSVFANVVPHCPLVVST